MGFAGERSWREALTIIRMPGIKEKLPMASQPIGRESGAHQLLHGFRVAGASDNGFAAFGEWLVRTTRASFCGHGFFENDVIGLRAKFAFYWRGLQRSGCLGLPGPLGPDAGHCGYYNLS